MPFGHSVHLIGQGPDKTGSAGPHRFLCALCAPLRSLRRIGHPRTPLSQGRSPHPNRDFVTCILIATRLSGFQLESHRSPPMQRKSFGNLQCPIARSLERVGEWWSILILRDAVYGLKRFDEFQKSLEIAPNMLTRRLNGLVKDGLLERQRYSDKPPRYEYVLTEK